MDREGRIPDAAAFARVNRVLLLRAGQHCVAHAAERPHAGPPNAGLAARLLGLHAGGGAAVYPDCVIAGVVIAGDIDMRR